MFQNLRGGSPLYILHKNEPKLSIGEVKNVSQPMPQFGVTYQSGILSQPKNTVDIRVAIDGEEVTLQKIPADLSIADFGAGMVVSENREAIVTEIEAFKHASEKHVADTPKHEHIVSECTTMLGMLNPHIARETEQEKKIETLTTELADIKAMLSGILERNNKPTE